jgi:RNA polymerase sigma-70 factor (ECF subfamily)
MAQGPAEGLRLLGALEAKGELRGYYLLPAAKGDLARRLERWSAAAESYRQALALVTNETERRFLSRRLAEAESKGQ